MVKEIAIIPGKCTGCSTCTLTCSLVNHSEFSMTKAYIKIKKDDMRGKFEICFLSTCIGCKKCAEACPTGCLSIVVLGE